MFPARGCPTRREQFEKAVLGKYSKTTRAAERDAEFSGGEKAVQKQVSKDFEELFGEIRTRSKVNHIVSLKGLPGFLKQQFPSDVGSRQYLINTPDHTFTIELKTKLNDGYEGLQHVINCFEAGYAKHVRGEMNDEEEIEEALQRLAAHLKDSGIEPPFHLMQMPPGLVRNEKIQDKELAQQPDDEDRKVQVHVDKSELADPAYVFALCENGLPLAHLRTAAEQCEGPALIRLLQAGCKVANPEEGKVAPEVGLKTAMDLGYFHTVKEFGDIVVELMKSGKLESNAALDILQCRHQGASLIRSACGADSSSRYKAAVRLLFEWYGASKLDHKEKAKRLAQALAGVGDDNKPALAHAGPKVIAVAEKGLTSLARMGC